MTLHHIGLLPSNQMMRTAPNPDHSSANSDHLHDVAHLRAQNQRGSLIPKIQLPTK